jgi:hypothetical protein
VAEAGTTYSVEEEEQVRVEEQNSTVTAVAAEEKDSEVYDLLSADVDRDDKDVPLSNTVPKAENEARLTQIHPTVEMTAFVHLHHLLVHCLSTDLVIAAIPRDLRSSLWMKETQLGQLSRRVPLVPTRMKTREIEVY